MNKSFFAGLVVGEGSFYIAAPSGNRKNQLYGFAIGMHERDSDVVDALHRQLDSAGTIHHNEKSKMYSLRISSRAEIRDIVIPYFDGQLGPTYKAIQFDRWKTGFLKSCEDIPVKPRKQRTGKKMSFDQCVADVKQWVEDHPGDVGTSDFLALTRPLCRNNQNLANQVKNQLVHCGFLEVKLVSKWKYLCKRLTDNDLTAV